MTEFENPRLRPVMREFLEIEGRDRLYRCWDRVFVQTDDTKAAFVALEDCMKAAPNTKPRGVVIVGDSDTGKSRTMTAFRDAHPPTANPEHEYADHPVLYIKAPDDPNPVVFLKKLLEELGFPVNYNAQAADVRAYTVRMLRLCRVGTVIVDEFRDIGNERMSAKLIDFFVFLKNLINEVERPFVVGGTRSVENMVASDPQLAGRLNQKIELRPFKIAEFVKVLLAFELMLPLRRDSAFREDERLIQQLYSMSGGYIGRLNAFLHDACQVAIESGEEKIFLSTLDRVQGRSIKPLGRVA